MNFSKLTSILCCFLLLVSLTFSVTALSALRTAVEESRQRDALASQLLARLEEVVAVMAPADTEPDLPVSSVTPDKDEENANPMSREFCIRTEGERIGIYTEEGYLIRFLDAELSLLPLSEQEALREGISVSTYRELIERIQSYEE